MSVDITVYSRPNCQQCRATTRKLDQLGVTYDYIDVSEDADAHAHIKSLGYVQAPVVVCSDGTHWSGFRPHLIEEFAHGKEAVGDSATPIR